MRLLVFVRALQEICRDDGSPKGKMRLPTQDQKGRKRGLVFQGSSGKMRGDSEWNEGWKVWLMPWLAVFVSELFILLILPTPWIGHIFIGCFASWREVHGSCMIMRNGGGKTWTKTIMVPTETHLSEVNVVQPIGGLGVATSISCILSFCGGTSCADFRFDFDAFWDGGDGWWWLGGSFFGFLKVESFVPGKALKVSWYIDSLELTLKTCHNLPFRKEIRRWLSLWYLPSNLKYRYSWWFRNPANPLRLAVYPSIYNVFYIPGG